VQAKILIVDDDPVHVRMVERLLGDADFVTATATTADEAVSQLETSRFDLLILDLGLPDEDGISVCRQLRGRWYLPIIMLTARAEADEKVLGLDVGADDYLTKPFEPGELLARVRAQLRRNSQYRSAGGEPDVVPLGDVELDLNERDARVRGELAGLTSREFEVLEFLSRYPNKAMPRETVFERVWGYAEQFNTNSLDVIIYRIRNKIEHDPGRPERLVTVRGFGYKLVVPEPAV
jgi:DNA-binding response OmpR family regulator